ncbi:MAG TPA: acetate/propionate family kinase [Burkholderiales bacterium]|nr:acetate/propionate family kinase [Burkholderiales bacterium]
MNDRILILNSGSSSIKFALFGVSSLSHPLLQGTISGLGASPAFNARDDTGRALAGQLSATAVNHDAALAWLFDWLRNRQDGPLVAAGHRVVHGGEHFAEPALVTAEVYTDLEQLVPLAPLHQPHNLAAIRALMALQPSLPQVACFDTAFHRTQDALAQHFALPRELTADGIKRYGFHGLSYEYIAGVLPQYLGTHAKGRVIVAHLGNGASLCAMRNRKSAATTMGFTALDGLMMGTRCGALDPGVLLYLMREKAMSPEQIEDLLYRHSGLLGVSGLSSDMRELLASPSPEAKEAVELFCYRAVREIGSLVAALGGLDALVFTAGIGERAHTVRARICERLSWLGVAMDETANRAHHTVISNTQSRIVVGVIRTNEETVIARHTARVIRSH